MTWEHGDGRPNAEAVNDLAKLAMHRVIARVLRRDPSLLGEATLAMDGVAERFQDRTFVPEWHGILGLPASDVARLLTERSERMDRLRLSSPFVLVERLGLGDVPLRRRIWRMAKRLAERAHPLAVGPRDDATIPMTDGVRDGVEADGSVSAPGP